MCYNENIKWSGGRNKVTEEEIKQIKIKQKRERMRADYILNDPMNASTTDLFWAIHYDDCRFDAEH